MTFSMLIKVIANLRFDTVIKLADTAKIASVPRPA